MAEGAFALSPLSASARTTAPTDADYEAIREAFMETARGRWFLGEYAKRNRNADTAMVLEAVARIEQSMAAARAEQAAAPEPQAPHPALAPLQDVRAAIETILAATPFDDSLVRWRRSSRIIQEIAWALRETGSDPRICEILDSQVRNIESTCDEFPSESLREQVLNAVDVAIRHVAPDIAETTETTPAAAKAESNVVQLPIPNDPPAGIPESSPGTAFESVTTATEQSATESVLVSEDTSAPIEAVEETALSLEQPGIDEPVAAAMRPEADLPEPTHAPASDAAPVQTPSLGESLIAQGLVKRPLSGRADPLAPIRRMNQAEKIAFFS